MLIVIFHCKYACDFQRGPWASASKEDVDAMISKGVPFCYRFRVPKV